MNKSLSVPARRDLRQRMIEDMSVRGFSAKTQYDDQRIVSRFAAFLGRSPDRATAEDIRRFQVEQREAGMPVPAMNSHVAALRFFFTTTLDRPDLSRKLIRVSYPPQVAARFHSGMFMDIALRFGTVRRGAGAEAKHSV